MNEQQQHEAMKADFRDQLKKARIKEVVTSTADIDSQPWAKRNPQKAIATKRLFAAVSHAVLEREKTLRDL